MGKKLNHVGIVVKDLDEATKLYCNILGLTHKDISPPKAYQFKAELLTIGDNAIELIQPTGTEGRFATHLREKGQGLFHLAVFIDDWDKEVKKLQGKGYKVEIEIILDGLGPSYSPRLAWISPEEAGGIWIELVDWASLPPSFSARV